MFGKCFHMLDQTALFHSTIFPLYGTSVYLLVANSLRCYILTLYGDMVCAMTSHEISNVLLVQAHLMTDHLS